MIVNHLFENRTAVNTAQTIARELHATLMDLVNIGQAQSQQGAGHPEYVAKLRQEAIALARDLEQLGYEFDFKSPGYIRAMTVDNQPQTKISEIRCMECGGPAFSDLILAEKKDACYYKVKASAKVWPSAYASGRLVQCRKKGAKNYGNKSKNEDATDTDQSRQPVRPNTPPQPIKKKPATPFGPGSGVAEGLESLESFDRGVINHMQDNTWLSAERAYFRMIGLQKKKDTRPSEYEQIIQRYIDLYDKYKGQQGVAEGLNEMDKSAPQPGRDGKVSHSTYGSRDKKGSDYFKGNEAPGKPITKKQMKKDTLDILKKQGVAEAFGPGSGVTEGIEGEIAGGAVGSLVGGAAGSSLGPIGTVVGSAVGGGVGSAIGGRYQDGKPLKEKQQLDEIAPLLAAGARLFVAAAPKIAQIVGKVGRAGAQSAGQAAKAGAEIAAKNAGQIGIGVGAYEIGSSVADIAKEITAKVGTAIDQKTVLELSTLAFKYAIPAAIVLAILYGGKKAIDSLFNNASSQQQGVAEGLNEFAPPGNGDGDDNGDSEMQRRLIMLKSLVHLQQDLDPASIQVWYVSRTDMYHASGQRPGEAVVRLFKYTYNPQSKKFVPVTSESLADDFADFARQRGIKVRVAGTPEQERERSRALQAERAKAHEQAQRERALADRQQLDDLESKFADMKARYDSLGGSAWQYADREQNLTASEREARSMESDLNTLYARIQRAKQVDDLNEGPVTDNAVKLIKGLGLAGMKGVQGLWWAVNNPGKALTLAAVTAYPKETWNAANFSWNLVTDPGHVTAVLGRRAAADMPMVGKWVDKAQAARDLEKIMGNTATSDMIFRLAGLAVDNALPIAGVIALLYGGTKFVQYLRDRNAIPPGEKAFQRISQELGGDRLPKPNSGSTQPPVSEADIKDQFQPMKLADYLAQAEALQVELSRAARDNDREVIQKLEQQRRELDSQARRGLVPEGKKSDDLVGGRHSQDQFDAMVGRLRQLANAGPLKTVWDPQRQVYRNVPVNPKQDKK